MDSDLAWVNGKSGRQSWRYADAFRRSTEAIYHFYRAMHFSAKRGIAIACRLSVRPSLCPYVRLSVTLVDCDHIGWNTSEIISPLDRLGCSIPENPNIMGLLQGEHPEILA